MPPDRILIIGSGTMGSGIAQTAVQSGIPTELVDVNETQLEGARSRIENNLAKAVDKGKLPASERDDALSILRTATEIVPDEKISFIIEAVPEKLEIKTKVYKLIESVYPPDEVILASNTSSISITQLAASTIRPDRFIGMHFFNPVPVMQLVEVIRGLNTSDETTEVTRVLAEKMGKSPVTVKDMPGFAANRILMPLLNEAIFALMEGVADAEDIDSVAKLGLNHPMGPLELADFIGLDVCNDVLQVMHREFGDPKYRPCPLLVQMVRAGRLGRKSGRGFYEYGE